MADLVSIFGGPFTLAPKNEPPPLEHQIADAMQAAGLMPPFPIHIDGKLHRFRSGTKGTPGIDKSGWYVFYSDGIPAGKFGDWRSGIEHNWRADIGRELSPAEEIINQRRMTEAKAARDMELERSRQAAANTVEKIWVEARHAEEGHPYLVRKGIKPHGARITGDGRLIVPLYGDDNKLSSLQYIDPEGGKLYHASGATSGKFWQVGTNDDPGVIYIAEGFATAATIHEVTNRPCVVAYSASNLVPVTGSIRERFGSAQPITIVADNDASGVGQKYADQASAKFGARVIMPPVLGDANDYFQEGNDLTALLKPRQSNVAATPYQLRPCSEIPLRKWLYGSSLIRRFLSLTVAPGGLGKSSMILVDALAMATGRCLLNARPVEPLRVWVWNGEDPREEVDRRLAAACKYYGITSDDIGNRLFIDSGRELPIKIAAMQHGKIISDEPLKRDIVSAIKTRNIDVLIVDPLVTTHEVQENETTGMNAVVAAWRDIADGANCAIELVHHVSKAASLSGDSFGIYGARGAGAIIDAVRCARFLTPMTIEQAHAFGITDPAGYFRVDDGKANLAPKHRSAWRKMISVDLQNGPPPIRLGDEVGICTAWTPPDPGEGVASADVDAVISAIQDAPEPFAENERSANWVGYLVAEKLNLDPGRDLKKDARTPSQAQARAKVRALLNRWTRQGLLKTETIHSPRDGRDMKVVSAVKSTAAEDCG